MVVRGDDDRGNWVKLLVGGGIFTVYCGWELVALLSVSWVPARCVVHGVWLEQHVRPVPDQTDPFCNSCTRPEDFWQARFEVSVIGHSSWPRAAACLYACPTNMDDSRDDEAWELDSALHGACAAAGYSFDENLIGTWVGNPHVGDANGAATMTDDDGHLLWGGDSDSPLRTTNLALMRGVNCIGTDDAAEDAQALPVATASQREPPEVAGLFPEQAGFFGTYDYGVRFAGAAVGGAQNRTVRPPIHELECVRGVDRNSCL